MFNQLYPNLEVCSEYIFKEKKSYTLSKLYTSVRLSLYNKGPFISDAEKSTKMVFQFCFIFFIFPVLKKFFFTFSLIAMQIHDRPIVWNVGWKIYAQKEKSYFVAFLNRNVYRTSVKRKYICYATGTKYPCFCLMNQRLIP